MAGSQQYTDKQIVYILTAYLAGKSNKWIKHHFDLRFRKLLTENQIRYLKNKYGKDPRFNTPAANGMVNRRNGYTDHEYEWGDDSCLQIDYSIFNDDENVSSQPVIRVTAPTRPAAAGNATRTPVTPASDGSSRRASTAVAPVTPAPLRGVTTISGGTGAGAASSLPTPASGASDACSARKHKKRRRGDDDAEAGSGELVESSNRHAHKTRRVGSPSVHSVDSYEHTYGAYDQELLESSFEFSSPLRPITPHSSGGGVNNGFSAVGYDPFVEQFIDHGSVGFDDSGFVDYNAVHEFCNGQELVPTNIIRTFPVQSHGFLGTDANTANTGGIPFMNDATQNEFFSAAETADLNTDWAYMPFNVGSTYPPPAPQWNTNLLPHFTSISEGVKTSFETSRINNVHGMEYAQYPLQTYPLQPGQLIHLNKNVDENSFNMTKMTGNSHSHYLGANGDIVAQQQVDFGHTSAVACNAIDAEHQAAFDAVMAKLGDAPYDGSSFVRDMEDEKARLGLGIDLGDDAEEYSDHEEEGDMVGVVETPIKSSAQGFDSTADMVAIPQFLGANIRNGHVPEFTDVQAGVTIRSVVNHTDQVQFEANADTTTANALPTEVIEGMPHFPDILDIFDAVSPPNPDGHWVSFEDMLNYPVPIDLNLQEMQMPHYDGTGTTFNTQVFMNAIG